MPLTISDKVLQQAGLTEREALVEIACALFDAGKLSLWPAARLAGLTRTAMEHELSTRNIAIYRPTVQDLMEDLATLDAMEARRERRGQ